MLIEMTNKYNALLRSSKEIKYTYTKDEFGAAAQKLHQEYQEKHGKPMISYAYDGDAGFDLPIVLSDEDRNRGHSWVWPGERAMLHTGMMFEFPEGYHGKIVHRSSCEKNYRLRVIEGTIDKYRGQILIQVANGNSCQVEVTHGIKLAQMIILPNCGFQIKKVNTLSDSQRGSNGFGSSSANDRK